MCNQRKRSKVQICLLNSKYYAVVELRMISFYDVATHKQSFLLPTKLISQEQEVKISFRAKRKKEIPPSPPLAFFMMRVGLVV